MKHSYTEYQPMNETNQKRLHKFLGDELLTLLMFEYYACRDNLVWIGAFDGYLKTVSANSVIAWAINWKESEFGEWYWSATNKAWLEYLISQRGM